MVNVNKVEKILNEAKVVNNDGSEYKPTKLEATLDWIYDHCFLYRFMWSVWRNLFSPKTNYYRLKRMGQRLIWGFSDASTWSLDWTFYNWVYPRLKRFEKVTLACPIDTTYEEWKAELKKRVQQLHDIIYIDEFDFTDWSYIPKKELAKLKDKLKHDGSWKMTVNSTAYSYCIRDFNKWFAENLPNLWW